MLRGQRFIRQKPYCGCEIQFADSKTSAVASSLFLKRANFSPSAIGIFDGAQFLAQRGQALARSRRHQARRIIGAIVADQRQKAIAGDKQQRAFAAHVTVRCATWAAARASGENSQLLPLLMRLRAARSKGSISAG